MTTPMIPEIATELLHNATKEGEKYSMVKLSDERKELCRQAPYIAKAYIAQAKELKYYEKYAIQAQDYVQKQCPESLAGDSCMDWVFKDALRYREQAKVVQELVEAVKAATPYIRAFKVFIANTDNNPGMIDQAKFMADLADKIEAQCDEALKKAGAL